MPVLSLPWVLAKVACRASLAIALVYCIGAQAQESSYRVVAIAFGTSSPSETAQPIFKSSFSVSGTPGRPYGWGLVVQSSERQTIKVQEELVLPASPVQWYQGESLGFKIGSDGVTAIREFEVLIEPGDNWLFAVRYPQIGDPKGLHTSSISLNGKNVAKRKFLVE